MTDHVSDDRVWAVVDEFEARVRTDPSADLATFLPPRDHPAYLLILTELVRLDLEFAWGRGRARPPEDYFAEFPELRDDPDAAAGVAYEDYRHRKAAGHPVTPGWYAEKYRVGTDDWPADAVDELSLGRLSSDTGMTPLGLRQSWLIRAAGLDRPDSPDKTVARGRAGSATAGGSADTAALPEVGQTFLGFALAEEIGRGAFGRVFLARQGDLAGRPVALKVGRGLFGETQTLARLQHTNIVPIHSAHRAGPLQALCMPFFGRTTLAALLGDLRADGRVAASGAHLICTRTPAASNTRPATSRPVLPPTTVTNVPPAPLPPADSPAAPPPDGPPLGLWALLADRPYIDAVVWAGAQLAAGLAHAHARGFLHRDLKPANVLLTDDGVPMLLDFNLAENTRAEHPGPATVGGTLPYMAPEQMAQYLGRPAALDARSDLYALGVILFEMLTGTRPFPDRAGPAATVVPLMIADRSGPPPSVRALNPHVPPSVEAIIRKLLANDPSARYPSAETLADDLGRHLKHQPLAHAPEPSIRERARKWAKRHPRLSSSGTVAAAAAVLVVGLLGAGYAARERTRTLEARAAFDDHNRDLRALQSLLDDRNQTPTDLSAGIRRCADALDRYAIPIDRDEPAPGWDEARLVRYLPADDRAKLREGVGELFYLMARGAAREASAAGPGDERAIRLSDAERWNRLAGVYGGRAIARAVAEQRADLARLAGRPADADHLSALARDLPPGSARDRFLLGFWYYQGGKYRLAIPELTAATAEDPHSFPAWFVRGTAHLKLEQADLAAMCFTACIALRPDFAPAWVNRGLALVGLRFADLAIADYTEAIRLDPARADAHVLRAGVYANLGRHADAIAGYSAALGCADCPTRVYFYRAASRAAAGDAAGAAADRAAAMTLPPTDGLSWVARASARKATDAAEALTDVEEALRINPLSSDALQLKAHLLAEHLNRPADALAALDRAVELYPDFVPARAGRGVLRARAGDRAGAVRDAEDALTRDSRPPNLYQVGCIYALTAAATPADRFKAVELIAAAVRGGFGRQYLRSDPDLNPIRKSAEFRKLLAELPDESGKSK